MQNLQSISLNVSFEQESLAKEIKKMLKLF